MKHRLGWTLGPGPSRWSFPTQPKHACSPQKQLHCERDWYRDLAAETFCPPRVRSPPPWRTCVFPCPPSPLSYPDFPLAAGSSPTVSTPHPTGSARRAPTHLWRIGDMRAGHRCYNDAALELGGYLLSSKKKTPKRLFRKSQAKKSHSLEWLFLCVWSGKRDSNLVSYPLKYKGFHFFPKQEST